MVLGNWKFGKKKKLEVTLGSIFLYFFKHTKYRTHFEGIDDIYSMVAISRTWNKKAKVIHVL